MVMRCTVIAVNTVAVPTRWRVGLMISMGLVRGEVAAPTRIVPVVSVAVIARVGVVIAIGHR